MDAKTFYETYGIEECRAVASAAGTNYAYFYQLVSGFRGRCSVDMAKRLVKASEGRLDFLALIDATEVA